MNTLEGKLAVVTGGGRGLGRVLTQSLVDQGAHVIVMGRGMAPLEATAALCPPDMVTPLQVDLCIADAVEAAFDDIRERFGKLDILINNAAIIEFFRLDEATPDQITRTLHGNLLAPMLTARFGAPLMRAAGAGDIINISSESVRNPYAFVGGYAAAKAGLENLSRALRTELSSAGIRVMTLQLGTLADPDRPMTMEPEIVQRYLQENQAAMQQSGSAMSLSTVAQAVLGLLTLPRDSSFELVELRGNGPAQSY